MNTNHDALRKELQERNEHLLHTDPANCSVGELRRILSQTMPEAAAQGWKDGDTAKLVNDLRDVAVQFHDAQQLRERIAHIIRPLTDRLSVSPAAPEGANPSLQWCEHCGEGVTDFCRGKTGDCEYGFQKPPHPQPQAQGEPEVVAHRYEFNNAETEGEPLITLQSHREAIAQHRAALEAERNRLDFLAQTQSYIEWNLAGDCCRVVPPNGFSHWFDTPRAAIDAAITHANQVLEGGGK